MFYEPDVIGPICSTWMGLLSSVHGQFESRWLLQKFLFTQTDPLSENKGNRVLYQCTKTRPVD